MYAGIRTLFLLIQMPFTKHNLLIKKIDSQHKYSQAYKLINLLVNLSFVLDKAHFL